MSWYDDIIIKGMYCDGCGKRPESAIVVTAIGILIHFACLIEVKGAGLRTLLQFLAAGNSLIFLRQLVIYHRRGSR